MDSMGERLYKLRKKNNMSQGDLANELDTSRQTISKWENNMCIPELDKIIRLCEIFSVSSDYILRGITENTNEEKEQTIVKEQTVIIEKTTDIKTIFASGLLINAMFFLFLFPKMFYIPVFFQCCGSHTSVLQKTRNLLFALARICLHKHFLLYIHCRRYGYDI